MISACSSEGNNIQKTTENNRIADNPAPQPHAKAQRRGDASMQAFSATKKKASFFD
jgi:hypothetical protein